MENSDSLKIISRMENKNEIYKNDESLKRQKSFHKFFFNSIFQGNMIYFFFDFKAKFHISPNKLIILFGCGFLTVHFFVNDFIIPKIFYFDPEEAQPSLLEEFTLHQIRFFKIEFLRRIFFPYNYLNMDSGKFSKEMTMDMKISNLNVSKI